ncbi:hypothetical protein K488DRAFT_71068 [Vararia minispora EC-137]|uniref:Uncharacterized protein n=1 Tax=Vararia minispora EC-137 TaxID=1314806 RepID=A0ACB8QJ63_9AGAM|nr:hypothetical protein K488DRAFT_71068 [Vararia minispora EC-137]
MSMNVQPPSEPYNFAAGASEESSNHPAAMEVAALDGLDGVQRVMHKRLGTRTSGLPELLSLAFNLGVDSSLSSSQSQVKTPASVAQPATASTAQHATASTAQPVTASTAQSATASTAQALTANVPLSAAKNVSQPVPVDVARSWPADSTLHRSTSAPEALPSLTSGHSQPSVLDFRENRYDLEHVAKFLPQEPKLENPFSDFPIVHEERALSTFVPLIEQFNSCVCLQKYRRWSPEELRFVHYMKGRKHEPVPPPAPSALAAPSAVPGSENASASASRPVFGALRFQPSTSAGPKTTTAASMTPALAPALRGAPRPSSQPVPGTSPIFTGFTFQSLPTAQQPTSKAHKVQANDGSGTAVVQERGHPSERPNTGTLTSGASVSGSVSSLTSSGSGFVSVAPDQALPSL